MTDSHKTNDGPTDSGSTSSPSVSLGVELAALFRRDLIRLTQEIQAFPDDATLWRKVTGISNPAGNLALHLEGNMREYIGRLMGGISYERNRKLEFALTGLTRDDLSGRADALVQMIPPIVAGLSAEDFAGIFPPKFWGRQLSTMQFLIHAHGHLNYHLGQIDYLRRVLTASGSIALAEL